jgi:hypothetical protein
MGQVDEDLDAFLNDVVGFPALDAGDEANATGVVFLAGVVKALRGGETGNTLGFRHIFSGEAISVAGLLVLRNSRLGFM